MLRSGDVIRHPGTGETFTWLRTGRETGGALAECVLALEPSAFLAAPHIHRVQEEKFEILEGRVRLRTNRNESVRDAGETVVVPAGTPHAWGPEAGAARIKVTFTPGNEIEDFFEQFCAWANEGRVNKKGMPPMHLIGPLAVRHELYLTGPPIPLQRLVMGFLGRLARAR